MSSKYERTYQAFNNAVNNELYDDDDSKSNSPSNNQHKNSNTNRTSLTKNNRSNINDNSPSDTDLFSTSSLSPNRWTKENLLHYTAISLTILSILFLIPGLTVNILTIKIQYLGVNVTTQSRSIIGTIQYLHSNHLNLAALLISIFSIVFPIIKSILFLFILFSSNIQNNITIYNIIKHFSKWAMNDIFVVAIFVAFLSTNANINIVSDIEPGFYYFLTYCILSLIAQQLYHSYIYINIKRYDEYELIPDTNININNNPNVKRASAKFIDSIIAGTSGKIESDSADYTAAEPRTVERTASLIDAIEANPTTKPTNTFDRVYSGNAPYLYRGTTLE